MSCKSTVHLTRRIVTSMLEDEIRKMNDTNLEDLLEEIKDASGYNFDNYRIISEDTYESERNKRDED